MNRNIENHRVAPSTSELYRRFAEKWQAEQFIGGEIRMRNLLSYRQEKDETRRDEWEGISSVHSQGSAFEMKYQGKLIASGHFKEDLRLKTKSPERYYISCMSTECVPRHRSWGEWVVKIRNPRRLFEELASETPSGYNLLWGPVEYCLMPTGPGILELDDIWRRKRMSFKDEREFRFALYFGEKVDCPNDGSVTLEFQSRDREFELIHDPA